MGFVFPRLIISTTFHFAFSFSYLLPFVPRTKFWLDGYIVDASLGEEGNCFPYQFENYIKPHIPITLAYFICGYNYQNNRNLNMSYFGRNLFSSWIFLKEDIRGNLYLIRFNGIVGFIKKNVAI